MAQLTQGIVAAGHVETARAAAAMLEAGGNAFDAAIAAMLATFVAEPALTSLGGGGFMTAQRPGEAPFVLDFFVQTPLQKRPAAETEVVESIIDFGTTVQPQYIGRGTVAVPGCPAGIAAIYRSYATLPLEVLAAPAIRLAREGCHVTPYQQYTFDIIGAALTFTPESAAVYGPGDGTIYKAGEKVRNPLFANALEHLVRHGFDDFYTGELAAVFAADQEANGGCLTRQDLAAFAAIRREPIQVRVGTHSVVTNPPPGEGGRLILHGLETYQQRFGDAFNGKPFGRDYVLALAETMTEMDRFRTHGSHPMGNTTHFSIMDQAGNTVSITTSQGGVGGVCVPDTGISLNNMLGELDLIPNGLHSWEPNVRVGSMMSPTLILGEDGRAVAALGTGGSSRIRTAILQATLNLLKHGLAPQQAVDLGRVHVQGKTLNVEPGLLPAEERIDNIFAENTILWKEKNMYFGGIHMVGKTAEGALWGAADARRDGVVLPA